MRATLVDGFSAKRTREREAKSVAWNGFAEPEQVYRAIPMPVFLFSVGMLTEAALC